MKISPKYKVERCASKDLTRMSLTRPYLDAERKLLVATNGNVLVGVPVEIDEAVETSGYVDPDALVAARKAAGRKAESIEVTTTDSDGQRFPGYEQVIPRSKPGDPGTLTLRFDVRLLRDILDGLGTNGSVVEMTIPVDEKRPAFSDDHAPVLVRNARLRLPRDPSSVEADPREVGVLMQIRNKS